MISSFILTVLLPLLVSAVIKLSDPKNELPEVVVIMGEGEIVNPDKWTPFPTQAPVFTPPPSAFPSEGTPPPTPADYLTYNRGGQMEDCRGETAVAKAGCLDAAVAVGDQYNFPYNLKEITDASLPCACIFSWNEDGAASATFNDSPTCGKSNDSGQLICKNCGSAFYNFRDYRGDENLTDNGSTCERWDDHKDNNPGWMWGSGIDGGNRECRNPLGPDRPGGTWCITSASGDWDYCNVPICGGGGGPDGEGGPDGGGGPDYGGGPSRK
mmetsp:Transcript_875/g.1066  ORF Transcript_875/g.1066 Transcript_875/m.1066 type:complete len:269 (-) Transcript_875:112-918(-)